MYIYVYISCIQPCETLRLTPAYVLGMLWETPRDTMVCTCVRGAYMVPET